MSGSPASLRGPSPSDFDRWEQLLAEGMEPKQAAAEVGGFTCSAFKRADRDRHELALLLSKEARGHFVDDRVEGWALASDASDDIRKFWAKRWQPAFRETGRVEVTGDGGGAVQVQGGVSLDAVLQVLVRAGAVGAEVPAAGEILAAPVDGERAASGVPAAGSA